jgi:hypothetical protein
VIAHVATGLDLPVVVNCIEITNRQQLGDEVVSEPGSDAAFTPIVDRATTEEGVTVATVPAVIAEIKCRRG